VNGWPTFDDVVAFLREHGKADMATVASGMRDEAQRCRKAAETSLKAYHELKMKHEPPPATPGWRSYQAKTESSD
jgi:hypothetical protein